MALPCEVVPYIYLFLNKLVNILSAKTDNYTDKHSILAISWASLGCFPLENSCFSEFSLVCSLHKKNAAKARQL